MEKPKKIKFSFSDYSEFNQCGHRYLVQKLLKLDEKQPNINLIYGSTLHKAIDIGFKKNISLEEKINIFKEDFRKEMMDNLLEDPSYKEVEEFIQDGEKILNLLDKENFLKEYEVVGSEMFIYEHIAGRFYFNGVVDLVLKNIYNNRFLIIDWKTSNKNWDFEVKKQDEIFMTQMQFYKYFVAKRFKKSINQVDCKYVVLSRGEGKEKKPCIQDFSLDFDIEQIKSSLFKMGETIKQIHFIQEFNKAKFIEEKKHICRFCQYYNKVNPFCDSNPLQFKDLMIKLNKK